MDGGAQSSVCPKCGSTETGSLFCKSCGTTLRQSVSLIPSDAPDLRHPAIGIGKRVLRGIVKTIALAAGVVFVFDNRVSGVAGIALLASVAVLLVCFFVWRTLDLGDDDWFWPRKTD